jgi:UDP:flavonoid glycosyltransferase YjiC (YdhE family)
LRILFTAWSFPGHINPTVALARALAERGHDIAFSTGERARPVIERQGFSLYTFQHLDEEKVYATVFSPISRSMLTRAAVLKDWLLETLPDQVRDQQFVLADWKPDIVVSDVTMWGTPLVLHELTGVPCVICSFAPGCMIPSPDVPPWGVGLPSPHSWPTRLLCRAAHLFAEISVAGVRGAGNEMRARFGLPPLSVPIHEYLGRMPLYLVPGVPELDYNRAGLPPSVHYIGPLIWNDTRRGGSLDWLATLSRERPWVHVSEGTMHVYQPFLLQAAAHGLANLPMEVIMTTGGTRDREEFALGPLAPNVRVEPWIAHTELFPHTDVVVTTGGAGTILTALEAGIPLVIVPTEWDKPDNAQRVVEAGAAIRISPRRCSPKRLREAVEQLLSDHSYRDNAKRLAGILKGVNGPRRAAELIEDTFPHLNRIRRAGTSVLSKRPR